MLAAGDTRSAAEKATRRGQQPYPFTQLERCSAGHELVSPVRGPHGEPRAVEGREGTVSMHVRAVSVVVGPMVESRIRLGAVAMRTADRMNSGTSCRVRTGHRNSTVTSTASRVAHAISATSAATLVAVSPDPQPTPCRPNRDAFLAFITERKDTVRA